MPKEKLPKSFGKNPDLDWERSPKKANGVYDLAVKRALKYLPIGSESTVERRYCS